MEVELKKLISLNSWFISLQVVTLLAFLGGAGFLYIELHGMKQILAARSTANGGPPAPREISNWQEYVRGHNAVMGDEKAKAVIVEFTDFQCPYCKNFSEKTRKQLLSKYGDKVRIVFKHYPLEKAHKDAKLCAVAAQCALRERKFWEIKDVFFKNPDELSMESLIAAGKSLGLGNDYAACVTNQETLAEVEQDIQDGMQVGVQGTPSFVINGKLVVGTIPMAQFESLIGKLN